jgi:hypothetical protein
VSWWRPPRKSRLLLRPTSSAARTARQVCHLDHGRRC